MNRPIRRVAVFASLMFLALLVNLTWLPLGRGNALLADPNNRRAVNAAFSQDRGAILVGNVPIAQSVASKGQFAWQRVYANGPLYAPITGYHSYAYGHTGLEQSMNAELSGTSDSQFLSKMMDTLSGRKSQGASVLTTINAKAQQAAWDALGDKTGAVVAINYRTGAILTMVSKPSYDPNLLATNDLSRAQDAWKTLTATGNTSMDNRAISEIYPPGSTFKLVTSAAALQNGSTPDTMVSSPSRLRLPLTNNWLPNEINCGGDHITLTRALEISCNTAYASIGMGLGADRLRTQADRFGFDANPGIGVAAATSRFPASPNAPQTALSAIGQYDVAASPLQMAMVAAGVANNGTLMKPYLVQEVRSRSLKVLSSTHPATLSQAMDAAKAQQLQKMMQSVVTNGTGRPAQVDGVTVGGKTGTAQSDPKRPPYAWFVGYANQPDVAICVFVQSADVARNDIAGGSLAGPVFASVVKALR